MPISGFIHVKELSGLASYYGEFPALSVSENRSKQGRNMCDDLGVFRLWNYASVSSISALHPNLYEYVKGHYP